MKVSWKLGKSAVYLLALAVAGAGGACSSSSSNGGTGGNSGSGGAKGTGGSTTVAGTGGSTTVAGTGGSTTVAGTGGSTTVAGTGGSTVTDSGTDAVVTGTGGASGDGSTVSDAAVDAVQALLLNDTFDTGLEGFGLSTFADSAGDNLGAPDASATPPVLSFDSTVGNPSPGSLSLTATFTKYNQTVDAQVGFTPVLDLTGKTLHAKVRIDSGSVAFAVIHASTTSSYVYVNGTFAGGLTAGTWTDLVFDLTPITATTNPGWNPAQVIQIGVQLGIGDPPVDAGLAAGSPLPAPINLVAHIDTLTD
jgi:hypothetical protein